MVVPPVKPHLHRSVDYATIALDAQDQDQGRHNALPRHTARSAPKHALELATSLLLAHLMSARPRSMVDSTSPPAGPNSTQRRQRRSAGIEPEHVRAVLAEAWQNVGWSSPRALSLVAGQPRGRDRCQAPRIRSPGHTTQKQQRRSAGIEPEHQQRSDRVTPPSGDWRK